MHKSSQICPIFRLDKFDYFRGADEGTRTHMVSHRNLKPARLPVSPHPHFFLIVNARYYNTPPFPCQAFLLHLLKIFKIKGELYRSPLSFFTAFIRLRFSLRYILPTRLPFAPSNLLRHTNCLRGLTASLSYMLRRLRLPFHSIRSLR